MRKKLAFLITGIIVIFLVSGCVMQQDAALANETGTETEETEAAGTGTAEAETSIEAPAQNKEQEPQEIPERTTYNKVVFDEDMSFTEFPAVTTVPLEEGMKYRIEFEAESVIYFALYEEFMHNKWKETGEHVIAKASSASKDGALTASGSYQFDINEGEGGTYYIVFDDSMNKMADGKPTTAKVKLTKVSNI